MGFPVGYTSDLARGGGGPADPSDEYQRRSAAGNSFHLPSVALLYALLLAPAGAGAFPIDGALRAPTRYEQFGHVHQHSVGSVFSPTWSAPDHFVRTSVQIFDEAIAMFPSHAFHAVAHTSCQLQGARFLLCPSIVFRISCLRRSGRCLIDRAWSGHPGFVVEVAGARGHWPPAQT